MTWLTPAELDREHWRWTRWRPQHGGWDQALWVELQDEWRRALLSDPSMVVIYAGGRCMNEPRCIRCKRPATRQTVIDVAVGPLAFCSALCEQLWAQAAAEREGWRS